MTGEMVGQAADCAVTSGSLSDKAHRGRRAKGRWHVRYLGFDWWRRSPEIYIRGVVFSGWCSLVHVVRNDQNRNDFVDLSDLFVNWFISYKLPQIGREVETRGNSHTVR